jgi:hypothetical protein
MNIHMLKMKYYNELQENLQVKTATAISIWEKKRLRYLERTGEFWNARMYLNLSEEELHGLLNLGQISWYDH